MNNNKASSWLRRAYIHQNEERSGLESVSQNKHFGTWCQWLMPIILATWEAETRRTVV
jgi:hypothetical protein